jgi:C4-dicarboxylate transporter DctQ subunit
MTVLERALALVLIAAVALNFVNVLGRYLLGRTLVGGDEVQTYAMVWIAFLGAAVVAWRGEHLRMDVVARAYPAALRRALGALEIVLVVLVVGFALAQSLRYVNSMLGLGAMSPMGQIPMWIPHSGVAFGLVLLVLAVLLRFARRAP